MVHELNQQAYFVAALTQGEVLAERNQAPRLLLHRPHQWKTLHRDALKLCCLRSRDSAANEAVEDLLTFLVVHFLWTLSRMAAPRLLHQFRNCYLLLLETVSLPAHWSEKLKSLFAATAIKLVGATAVLIVVGTSRAESSLVCLLAA